MDIMHIEARYTKIVTLPKEFITSLPQEITLFTTIQFMNSLEPIKTQLNKAGITVHLTRPRHCQHAGQLLGCSTTSVDMPGGFVYIGDGLFHPKALVLRNKKKVYAYNPTTGQSSVIEDKDVKALLKRLKGNYARFLSAKNIGVLITLKPGQQKEFLATQLEEKYPDKSFYYFVDNTFDFASLENFSFIDMYLNTMCERIGVDDSAAQDISMLNVEDLIDLQNGVFD